MSKLPVSAVLHRLRKIKIQLYEAMDRIIASAPKFSGVSYPECLDCGENIPYQRQQIGGVKRCIDCQNVRERRR